MRIPFASLAIASLLFLAACGGHTASSYPAEQGTPPEGGTLAPTAYDGGPTCPGVSAPSCTPSSGAATPTSIVSGASHTCALFSDGSVQCWGDNTYGQLGFGASCNASAAPVPVSNLCGAIAIAAGSLHTCAVLTNGTVACWGNTPFGTPNQNVPAAVDAGAGTCPILASTGQPMPFGSEPSLVPCVNDAVAVAAGDQFDCAVTADGTVTCWGGEGTASVYSVPSIDTAVGVAVVGGTGCAVLRDGTVKCWGANESGELGDGTVTASSTPVTVQGISNAVAVTTNGVPSGTAQCRSCYYFACALLGDGTVRCWGEDESGELGNGVTSLAATSTPVTVSGLANVASIASGEGRVYATLRDGTVAGWGYDVPAAASAPLGSNEPSPIAIGGVAGVRAVSSGVSLTCALLDTSAVECWGDEGGDELGAADAGALPVTVAWWTN